MLQFNLKACHNLFVGSKSGEFKICLGQDVTLMNDQGVGIIDTFLPQRTKKFVRIGKMFELMNFELSDGFC